MATIYSKQYKKAFIDVPSEKIERGEYRGKPEVVYFEHTLAADVANADILKLFKMPKGGRLLDFQIQQNALGGSCAGNIGWAAGENDSAVANGIAAAVDLSSAAVDTLDVSAAGRYKQFVDEVDVQIAFTAASSSATGKVIKGYAVVAVV
jgi:hypothetical protein